MTTDSNVVETTFKTKEGYNECDHYQSVLSPAAYFVKLMETIEKYISTHQLKTRRPDLFKLELDCNSTNKTKLYLEIANEIIEKNLGGNALQKLATAKYPFNLPANFPLISVRAYLEKQGITLSDLYKTLKPDADNVAESLKLSPEEYELVTSTSSNSSEVYGASINELKNVEKFIAQTNIDYDKLERLRVCYNKIKKPPSAEELTIGNETRSINGKDETFQVIKGLNDQALGFLHRFIRLANKLGWSFDELSDILITIDKKEIDAAALEKISRIKSLQKKFKKPLANIFELYSHDLPSSVFKKIKELPDKLGKKIESSLEGNYAKLKDLIAEEDDYVILQSILGINDRELTDLISAKNNESTTDKSGRSWILKAHKQVLLSRLIGISIAELIQILLLSRADELNNDLYTDYVVELKDWLKEHSITIKQLGEIINYSRENAEKIESLKKDVEEKCKEGDRQEFLNCISQHKADILEPTCKFVDKYLIQTEPLNKTIPATNTLMTTVGDQVIFFSEEKADIYNNNGANVEKSWTTRSNTEARTNPSIAVVGEKAIFFGGKRSDDEYSKQIDIYDTKENSQRCCEASQARESALVTVVNNGNKGKQIIFFGGNKKGGLSDKIDVYDSTETDSQECWKTYTASEARKEAKVAVVDDKVVFFGGLDSDNRYSNKVDIYNVEDKNLSTHEVTEGRANPTVAIVNNKAIFFGGQSDRRATLSTPGREQLDHSRAIIDIYDAKAKDNQWKSAPYRTDIRENVAVATIGNKAIFFGGCNQGEYQVGYSSTVDIYDDSQKSWMEYEDDNIEARCDLSVATIDDKEAIFFCGKNDQGYSDQVNIYDNNDQKWSIHKASEGRSNVTVVKIDKEIIFFCGQKGQDSNGNPICSSKIDIYDSSGPDEKKRWRMNKASEGRVNVSVAIVDKKVIFFGGEKGNGQYSSKIDVYDSEIRDWIQIETHTSLKEVRSIIQGKKVTFVVRDNDDNIQKYTIDYDKVMEKLLESSNLFSSLKLQSEDIKNITNHGQNHDIKIPWSIDIDRIKSILKYKVLRNKFSNFAKYQDWFYGKDYDENKVIEEIANITSWSVDALEDIKRDKGFEKCFTKEVSPADSLVKLTSVIDLVDKSKINVSLLLKLKELNKKSAKKNWNEYKDIAENLKVITKIDPDDKIVGMLEEKKCDALSSYMIHHSEDFKRYINNKQGANKRDLSSYLLIDVEMSDCSKISPLKAGLNSLQLYIHRCILELEEGAKVSSELTEEMWDLLDNYREWEVTKKVALYPENYLNPTLRKSATAEYKELQNTLMQGNLTDEEAASAYIKYFEDFAQLVNLQIVDTYHVKGNENKKEGESENKGGKLYILGRTMAEPYTYYYRTGDFGNSDENPQKWKSWEKIDTQIPVKAARVIHAFGRLFVFWLQKTEKEKQVEGASIDDSTLAVHYIFQKVDGSWSAQQNLSHYIKRDHEYEARIRDYLDKIDSHKQHIAGRKEDDSANKYCRDEIARYKNFIKEEVRRLKDIQFSGKIDVGFYDSHEQEILIISREAGFSNSKFALKENLESTTSYVSYFKDDNSSVDTAVVAAKESITENYKELKKKYNEEVENKKEIIKGIKKREKAFDELKKEIMERERLDKEADGIIQQLTDTSAKSPSIKETVKRLKEYITDGSKTGSEEGNKLAEDLENKLSTLTSEVSIQGNTDNSKLKGTIAREGFLISVAVLLGGQAKKEILQAIGSAFQQKLDQVKNQDVEQLKTRVRNVLSKVDKLETEATDNGLENELKDIMMNDTISVTDLLEEGQAGNSKLSIKIQDVLKKRIEGIKKLVEDIKNLKQPEKAIGNLKNEKDEFKKEKLKLKNQREELERDVAQDIIEERKKELNKKEEEEKILIESIIRQRNGNSESYVDEEILRLVKTLYKEAYIKGASAILALEKQQELRFKGFYGVYLWEIFFHIPTLIAYLFNQEQKFAEARKWYQYILNPLKKGCDSWQFIPFKAKCPASNSKDKCDSGKLVDLIDPYEEAKREGKVSFEKHIIMSYVDNLIDWGDMLFSQNSWEGINQATMLYIRAWDLLGGKPKKKGKHVVECSKNVSQLLGNKNNICKLEADTPTNTNLKNTVVPSRTTRALDTTMYCSYFCTPENKDFIGLWDRVEDRLYKIRHCLDIKGHRLELPLFQPPIDPRQLINAAASGSTMRLSKIAQVPHYRFKYMITYAKSIADTVTQIGSELLSVLEKKDSEALNLLYNKQEAIMANLMTTIKEKAIETLKEEAKALNASLGSANHRKSHYEKLISGGILDSLLLELPELVGLNGLSVLEIAAMGLSATAVTVLASSIAPELAAAVSHLIPNIFGFSCGGSNFGEAVEVGAETLRTTSNVLSNLSQNMSTFASYQRRAEDWDLQKTMATYDTEQISHQIEANKINQANAVQDLKAHNESIKQIREKEQFFRSKFTNQELYSWMKGELKSLYIRVYRLALEIARQAEWAYQYEIDNDKTFIQSGHWNNLKEGLLSGQKLKFDLEQLDKEYHDKNERRLEINKVISLKSLDPIALYELQTKGSCKFSFIEKLFDLDFPGHYARKIKDIKITIPAVIGPYENVHASLQQTSNQIVLKSEGAINAIKYLLNPSEEEQPENDLLRANWKPNQEIAISKADQDSGLFELSFGDERYLPFEGTGAVSTWELSLPQATNRFDVSSISDVIIHLDYTALNGGEALSKEVKNLNQIKYYQGTLVMNLSSIYSEEWEKFKQTKEEFSELNFRLPKEVFPIHINNPEIDLDGENNIYIIPITPDISSMAMKVNDDSWERDTKKVINSSLTISSDWNIKIENADISKVEEIIVIVPYKAKISWK